MNLNAGKIKVGIIAIIIAIIAIIIVVFSFVLHPNSHEDPSTDVGEQQTVKSESEKIFVKAVESNNIDSKRDVQIVSPEIDKLKDYAFQEYINNKIRSNVKEYQNEINIVSEDAIPGVVKYKYKVNYDRYNNGNYLSLVLNQNFQSGGMRSNSWKDIYNIDVVKCREIYLADLFETTIDYKQEITKEINMQATFKGYELVGGNGLETIPDKQKFYIKDDKLIIYFDPAAIAPYVYGELHFEMPFTEKDGKFYLENMVAKNEEEKLPEKENVEKEEVNTEKTIAKSNNKEFFFYGSGLVVILFIIVCIIIKRKR